MGILHANIPGNHLSGHWVERKLREKEGGRKKGLFAAKGIYENI